MLAIYESENIIWAKHFLHFGMSLISSSLDFWLRRLKIYHLIAIISSSTLCHEVCGLSGSVFQKLTCSLDVAIICMPVFRCICFEKEFIGAAEVTSYLPIILKKIHTQQHHLFEDEPI